MLLHCQIIGKNYTITYHLTLSDAQTRETIRFQVPTKQPNLHANPVGSCGRCGGGNGCENTIDLVVNPRPIIPVLAPR
jgi:hypothetical protein